MTLVPQRDKSMNFDESDNIIIEGDNLEVLRLLEKSYFKKLMLFTLILHTIQEMILFIMMISNKIKMSLIKKIISKIKKVIEQKPKTQEVMVDFVLID